MTSRSRYLVVTADGVSHLVDADSIKVDPDRGSVQLLKGEETVAGFAGYRSVAREDTVQPAAG